MPTEDMTAISAKVRTDEKALFGLLCKTEGLIPTKAIRSFILACNEQGAISDMMQDIRSAIIFNR